MLVVSAADVHARAAAIEAALAAGVDAIQLRDRGVAGGALLVAATVLRASTRRHGARLLVNDRIDVALAADADGVHLPASSFVVADARRLVGRDRLVGRSAHATHEVAAAVHEGADYVVLGPIFATPSKAQYGAPLGMEVVAAVATFPVVAIGGITAERAVAARAAGAAGVAVVRAILDAADPGAAATALVGAVASRTPPSTARRLVD
jgi:thiamine-phosphate pyrophosphorylase